MTRTVCLLPRFSPGAIGGVANHISNLKHHLILMGWYADDDPSTADLVHTHAVAQYPVVDVYTSHGIHPMNQPLADWQRDQNRAALDNLKLARQVVAVSQWTADQWLPLVGAVNYRVIPNGIDLDDWQDVPRGRWRARLGLSKETPLILWPKTGVNRVLDPTPALELALRNPDAVVAMPLTRDRLPTAPTNVKLIGPQSFAAMQMLIADCDVYLATTQENHSIGVLEAMALGKVVLGYDWGGTRETITSGVDGVLVAPGDMDALDARLEEVLERSNNFGQAARQTVADRYQWDKIIPNLVEVYEMALQAKDAESDPERTVVSIVIPVYNKAAYVREAVLSALSQTGFPHCEVIAVNDGSTDDSLAVLRELEGKWDNRLTVIDQPNQGVAAARNNGIRASHGEFICCLDADDTIDPLFLSRTVPAMRSDPGLGIAYTDFIAFGERDGQTFETTIQCSEYSFDLLKQRNLLPCCNLFRRTAWERAGGYKNINPSWEDYELWLNMGKLGWYGRRVPGAFFRYRKVQSQGRDHESHGLEWKLRGIVNSYHRDLYPPAVSIVIPCYKQAKFLGDAIDSALGQTFPDIEIVVVDDGNEPDEKTEIETIATGYRGLRLVQIAQNVGLATARNTGIDAARGTWIVPLDADDALEPEFIESCLQATEMDPRRFAYADSLLWWPAEKDRTQTLQAHDYDFSELLQRVTWPCTILYAKDAWRQAGGYKPIMSHDGGWEDWEFAITLGEIGVCGEHVGKALFRYRQHSPEQMRFKAERNRDRLRETMRRLHPVSYRGERMAGCCGGGRRSTPEPGRAGSEVVGSTRGVKTSSNGAADGTVMVRYVGSAMGARTWQGPSGQPYRFGISQPLQKVRAEDASMFAALPEFQIVPA